MAVKKELVSDTNPNQRLLLPVRREQEKSSMNIRTPIYIKYIYLYQKQSCAPQILDLNHIEVTKRGMARFTKNNNMVRVILYIFLV
jgi:hypothetical protein